MSIQSEINRIRSNVSDALAAASEMGASVPSSANSNDLGDLIRAIPKGSGGSGGFQVKSITTTGQYDTNTYHRDYWAAIDASGNLIVTVVGGTSTAYESVYFIPSSMPDGVSLAWQSYYSYSSTPVTQLYAVVFSGVKSDVNITLDFYDRNSSSDYVTCGVAISKDTSGSSGGTGGSGDSGGTAVGWKRLVDYATYNGSAWVLELDDNTNGFVIYSFPSTLNSCTALMGMVLSSGLSYQWMLPGYNSSEKIKITDISSREVLVTISDVEYLNNTYFTCITTN